MDYRKLDTVDTETLMSIITLENEKAEKLYSKDFVLGTYFDGCSIVNIIAPTLGALCSLSSAIFEIEEKKYEDISFQVNTRDIRGFSLEKLQTVVRLSNAKFNQKYVRYIKGGGLAELIINVINGNQTEPEDNFEQFVNKTTEKEKDALRDIIERIGEEGQVSLSALIQITKISRPVYTSLLSKLKEFNIAEVVNAGVKGTKIKFTNFGVFDI